MSSQTNSLSHLRNDQASLAKARKEPLHSALLRDPDWIRLPPPLERCPHSGLSRSTLSELVLPGPANCYQPPVKSAVVKKAGAVRGIRLINYHSLLAHLDRLADETNAAVRAPVVNHGHADSIVGF